MQKGLSKFKLKKQRVGMNLAVPCHAALHHTFSCLAHLASLPLGETTMVPTHKLFLGISSRFPKFFFSLALELPLDPQTLQLLLLLPLLFLLLLLLRPCSCLFFWSFSCSLVLFLGLFFFLLCALGFAFGFGLALGLDLGLAFKALGTSSSCPWPAVGLSWGCSPGLEGQWLDLVASLSAAFKKWHADVAAQKKSKQRRRRTR